MCSVRSTGGSNPSSSASLKYARTAFDPGYAPDTDHLNLSRGEACVALRVPDNVRIWHRNYYERIVRTPEAERNIRHYIRMNPWRLVQHARHNGQSCRMIGNPALLNREKIAALLGEDRPSYHLSMADIRTAALTPGKNTPNG